MVPYGRYKNLPLETRANEHFSTGELNAKQNAIQFFSILVFFSSVGNFFNRILVFDPPVENVLWLGFLVEDYYSARKGPHPVALRD